MTETEAVSHFNWRSVSLSSADQLRRILDNQTLDPEGPELRALRGHRVDVDAILRSAFPDANLSLRYGGSKAKGTMIKASYDLDIVAYFHHQEAAAGNSLAEIFNAVRDALAPHYFLEEKTSAIRLFGRGNGKSSEDLQIDVVPGRFVDETRTDCYLFQADVEKSRLKTNLETHIDHVRSSGVTDALRLLKLTRVLYDLKIKQFALDLLGVELLTGASGWSLSEQFAHVLNTARDATSPIQIQDPANPNGNDLSGILHPDIWNEFSVVAGQVLDGAAKSGWGQVLGEPSSFMITSPAVIVSAVEAVDAPTKPWTSWT